MNVFGCASLSCSMWDLSSLTKDRTQAPALGAQSLRYWDHQETSYHLFLYKHLCLLNSLLGLFDLASKQQPE